MDNLGDLWNRRQKAVQVVACFFRNGNKGFAVRKSSPYEPLILSSRPTCWILRELAEGGLEGVKIMAVNDMWTGGKMGNPHSKRLISHHKQCVVGLLADLLMQFSWENQILISITKQLANKGRRDGQTAEYVTGSP